MPPHNRTVLARWLQGWTPTPTVTSFDDCAQTTTALAWLQHHTSLPAPLLQKLFRKRVVRRYHEGKVVGIARAPSLIITTHTPRKQVAPISPSSVMPPHALLLIPAAVTTPPQPTPAVSPAALKCYETLINHHVLFQDDALLVLNKPAGLAAQGGTHIAMSIDKALAAGAAHHNLPPYRLVHRLDRATSGAMAVACSKEAAAYLTAALDPSRGMERGASIFKEYWAVVAPRRPAALASMGGGMLRGMVAGRSDAGGETIEAAVTRWELVEMVGGGARAWLRLWPQTGRKHQLRVHCASLLDAPIVGDRRYGDVEEDAASTPLYLHARRLRVPHPDSSKGVIDVEAPLPAYFERLINHV